MIPRRSSTGLLLAGLAIPAILGSPGCRRRAEPSRVVPPDWLVWTQSSLAFRYPSRCTVTTENFDVGELKVFVYDGQDQESLLLCLVFGDEGPFPAMQAAKNLPERPAKVRIHGHSALRCGPGRTAGGAFSEGLIELGGEGSSRSVHFYYANLDSGQQDLAETIIASVLHGE